MAERALNDQEKAYQIAKAPTGIGGFDEITAGGLPRDRVSLVYGLPGSGKTIFLTEFLARGAAQYGEPGVLVSFEESVDELIENSSSLGLGVPELVDRGKIAIDYIGAPSHDVVESGNYELTPLFERIQHAIEQVGAQRVAIDSLEALFAGFRNEDILRMEIRKLFRWLRTRGVTAVVTAEQGLDRMTRHGFEEYLSDCVVMLGSRIESNVTTRFLRIVKYRGSVHRTNEYPFMIYDRGLSVLPLSSAYLDYDVSTDRVGTGVPGLDGMLGGEGYYVGSTILISGSSGTGKTSYAAAFVEAACRRSENALFYALEEGSSQITRNMESIGIRLGGFLGSGQLHIAAIRSTNLGIETHLAHLEQLVGRVQPSVVVLDAVSNLLNAGTSVATKSMLIRAIDFLKQRGITTLLTSLVPRRAEEEESSVEISSFIDTWLVLKNEADGCELRRTVQIVKSRGMNHSHQIVPFHITTQGLILDAPAGGCDE